jgi:hypothetical protein
VFARIGKTIGIDGKGCWHRPGVHLCRQGWLFARTLRAV